MSTQYVLKGGLDVPKAAREYSLTKVVVIRAENLGWKPGPLQKAVPTLYVKARLDKAHASTKRIESTVWDEKMLLCVPAYRI